jgi:hypothetical protein
MLITFLGNFQVSFSSETHHAKSLQALGHTVIQLQENEATSEQVLENALRSRLFIWVHTHSWTTPGMMSMVDVLKKLKNLDIPTMTYHLDLWKGIQRERDLVNDEFYSHIQHFFTVDRLMADWFNENTEVKGHYLRAGVFDEECEMFEPNGPMNDVIFVGSKGYHPEWPWRPRLIEWLQETYGDRFTHYGGDGVGVVRGHNLNQLYANTKVVVGDSLVLNFTYPDYWSDRVYETIGRGGFLLMPYIEGIRSEFNESELATFTFGDFENLKRNIDFYLSNDLYRNTIRQNGFRKVKYAYTYRHRWDEILTELQFND